VTQEPRTDEVVDALPVLSEPVTIEVARPVQVAARQAAALAATSFVAGAATVAVVGHRRAKLRRRRLRRRKGVIGDIVASNSFLVDVHLLRRD
jgi:hypothetical protein